MAQIVSVAIDNTALKVLVVEGKRVKKAVTVPLETGLVKDGVIVDKATLSQKIRHLFQTERITNRKVVASISGIHSIYRLFTLPRLDGGLLAEAVNREAERILRIPLSELYLSWQTIPVSKAEILVCLLGLPRSSVDSVVDTLRQAGLDPSLMDTRPLAVTRAVAEAQAIIIDIQPAHFDIVLTVNGIPELVRSLSFSRRRLLSPDKAAEVRDELDKTIRFYNTSHETTPIPPNTVLFIGGDAEVSELLRQETSYPVGQWMIPLSFPEDVHSADYIANIGLVLKVMRSDHIPLRLNLNILPEAYLPKPIPVLSILSWLFVIVAVGLLAWLVVSTRQAIAETSSLKTQLSQVQTLIKGRQGDKEVNQKVAKLQAQLKEVTTSKDNIRQLLAGLESQRAKVTGSLSKATSLLPANVDLIKISYADGLTVEGTSTDADTVLAYTKSLKESGRFSQALVSFETKAYRQVSFTVTLK